MNERSSLVTVSVPPDPAVRLSDALLELRRSKDDPGPARPEVRSDERAWLDGLIDRLSTSPASRAIELTGPRDLLHEATLVAIDDAGESVSESCTNLLRGEGESDEVRADVLALDALLELLREIHPARQP
ncbi:MAG: hypothetical protein ACRDL0_16780 [Thermoleophilaceae bacterium]